MFENRADAGRQLLESLHGFRGPDTLVLALPRGGVVVGREIADGLDAQMDVLIVRKLGAPGQPELAVGALVYGNQPQVVFNEKILNAMGIDRDYLKQEYEEQLAEAKRRDERYRGGKSPPKIRGRTVILVDDGIATGATVKAALRGLKLQKPKRLVLAVPVAPPETLLKLQADVDEVICLRTPPDFQAVGQFYKDFHPVSDEEVVELLKHAKT
jgi:predicted phosphoribosyltransferase